MIQTEFLTPKEVAVKIGVNEETLSVWRRDRKGPPFIRRVGRIYYNAADLDQWYRNGDQS